WEISLEQSARRKLMPDHHGYAESIAVCILSARVKRNMRRGYDMREYGRNLPMLPALALLVGGVLGALVACKPIQGYPGLERPKEEVALVTVASNHINRAVADGREFGASGIRLLPGSHRFELLASHGEPPYGCRPYTIVDTYGFDRC